MKNTFWTKIPGLASLIQRIYPTTYVSVVGQTWFVRPVGGDYGLENGTSHTNAWDGLLNVVWGAGGVQPGDTLWISGTHIYEMTSRGYVATQADMDMVAGTGENSRVTIRGDHPGDPGIVWGSYIMNHTAWQQEPGYPNVWSVAFVGNHYSEWYFEKVSDSSYSLLDKETSIAAVANNPVLNMRPLMQAHKGGNYMFIPVIQVIQPKELYSTEGWVMISNLKTIPLLKI